MDTEPLIIPHTREEEDEVNTLVTGTNQEEKGSVGNGNHEVEKENHAGFNPSDFSKYFENGQPIGTAMSPTEEVPENYLKNMFMMPSNHEFCCPSCYVRIDKVFFRTGRQPIVPIVTNPPLEPADTEPQVIERDEDYAECLVVCSTCDCLLLLKDNQLILVSLPLSADSDDLREAEVRSGPANVECLVRCVIGFMLVIEQGKKFITGLVSRTPEPEA